VRPIDAAGLVLVREGRHGPQVLLGRRHRKHTFLPDIYVFPGGRLDPEDSHPSGFAEPIAPDTAAQLQRGARGRPPLAFLRAAIRETFEEAGLLLATGGVLAASPGPAGGIWSAFREQGAAPAFGSVAFICRAITPSSSPRRYNTRFFLAEAPPDAPAPTGDGELEDLRWWPIEETGSLGLVDVTEFVLGEALRRRARPAVPAPVPLLCYRGETMRLLHKTAPAASA
jgi:8-oxo-dGTP pyrophosphatase MutT (NUDIX family)